MAEHGGTGDGDSESEREQDISRARKEAKNAKLAKEFLCGDGSALETFFVIRAALSPQIALMHKVITDTLEDYDHASTCDVLAGPATDVFGYWNGTARVCRREGLSALHGKHWGGFFRNEAMWQHLTHSEARANEIMRSVLRVAGALHDLVTKRTEKWPYKAFEVIAEPDNADTFIRDSLGQPCLLDSGTKDLFQRYGRGELRLEDLKSILMMMGLAAIWEHVQS